VDTAKSHFNIREGHITPKGGLKASMFVYVLNQNGHPLMPCTPAKARRLLQDGKAKVIVRCPFTCHKKLHQGKIHLKVTGVSGHLDQIAQRSMQGKNYLYSILRQQTSLSTIFGYQTATLRKARELPKTHDADALCIAMYDTGEMVPYNREHFYVLSFRPRRTRRQYHDLPRKGQGRVRYQVNDELAGFRKGDVVRVKGRYRKQVNAIYSEGRLAFKRIKGEPANAKPEDCQLLERGRTMLWEKATLNARERYTSLYFLKLVSIPQSVS
jgi:hypothetical protein